MIALVLFLDSRSKSAVLNVKVKLVNSASFLNFFFYDYVVNMIYDDVYPPQIITSTACYL